LKTIGAETDTMIQKWRREAESLVPVPAAMRDFDPDSSANLEEFLDEPVAIEFPFKKKRREIDTSNLDFS